MQGLAEWPLPFQTAVRLPRVSQNLPGGRGTRGDKAGGIQKPTHTEQAPATGGKRNRDEDLGGQRIPGATGPWQRWVKWGRSSQRSVGCSHLLQRSQNKTAHSQTSPPLSSQQTSSKPTSKAPIALRMLCSHSPSTLTLNLRVLILFVSLS